MVPSLPVDIRQLRLRGSLRASWIVAAAVLLAESALALAGVRSLVLTTFALLAPGCALAGLLPAPIRCAPLARIAAMPALGLAATSVAMISVARLGVPLTGWSTRAVLLALVVAGALIPAGGSRRVAGSGDDGPGDGSPDTANSGSDATGNEGPSRGPALLELVTLAAILVAAAVLGWRVVGSTPVPGNDWAKYLLYADQIARHHTLLLDNPYWLGGIGIPFREDPGMPAIYGPALIMSGAPAGALAKGILGLAVMLVLTTYAAGRAAFGRVGGLAAAATVTLMPASQNILGWHGLANLGALVLAALVLAQLGAWLAGDLDRRGEAGLALTVVAVVAAHRLTSVVVLGVVGCVGLAQLALVTRKGRPEVRAAAGSVARIAAFTVVLGLLVALDLRARSATAGGTLGYENYLDTKVVLWIAVRNLTWLVLAGAGLTLTVLIARRRLRVTVWPAVAFAFVTIAFAYAWVLHLPGYYARMTFFLPVALGPIIGAGVGALWAAALREPNVRRQGIATGMSMVAAVLAALLFAGACHKAAVVHRYYAFANTASLRGLDRLAATLRPGEPVTTDRCWSFLSAWLLQHPTYPALANQDIGPGAEVPYAQVGRAMIEGTADGDAFVRKLGVRYALVDPTCPVSAVAVQPRGEVVFASTNLAIVRLSASRP